MGIIRVDKMLSEAGIGSRTEIKEYVSGGRVRINGYIVKTSDQKVDPLKDEVTFDMIRVNYAEKEYYMLNKPAGVISSTEEGNTTTVVDLIEDKIRNDLFPVGRLDKDTEGLLIITNDGDLSHRLLSPKKHVEKEYFAIVKGKITKEDKEAFARGLEVDKEFTALPASLSVSDTKELPPNTDFDKDTCDACTIIIKEGKFHQIKRMFEAVGKEVVYLKRVRMGPVLLDNTLPLGGYRPLTAEELESLGVKQ